MAPRGGPGNASAVAGGNWACRRAPSARAECVAVDAMAFEPLADAPRASLSYSQCQTAQFLRSRLISCPGSLPSFFSFVAADPRARGLAERPETSSLVRVAQ